MKHLSDSYAQKYVVVGVMLSFSTLAVFTTLTVETSVSFFKLVTVIRYECTYIHFDQARREFMGQGRLPCSILSEYSALSYMVLLSAETGIAGNAVHVGTYHPVIRISKTVYLRSLFRYISFFQGRF